MGVRYELTINPGLKVLIGSLSQHISMNQHAGD